MTHLGHGACRQPIQSNGPNGSAGLICSVPVGANLRVDMRRRHFIWLVGGAAAWPAVARAQQADQIRRVGALMSGIETDAEQKARWDSFRKSLEGLGWLEGRNVHIEVRFAGGRSSKFESLAKEMVALQQD